MRHKHADLIHAFAEGAEIQFLSCKTWLDFDTKNHTWHPEVEYRIKPKTVKKWQWAYPSTFKIDHWNLTDKHLSREECHLFRAVPLMNTEIEVQE